MTCLKSKKLIISSLLKFNPILFDSRFKNDSLKIEVKLYFYESVYYIKQS